MVLKTDNESGKEINHVLQVINQYLELESANRTAHIYN
jgi:hypothetical protein